MRRHRIGVHRQGATARRRRSHARTPRVGSTTRTLRRGCIVNGPCRGACATIRRVGERLHAAASADLCDDPDWGAMKTTAAMARCQQETPHAKGTNGVWIAMSLVACSLSSGLDDDCCRWYVTAPNLLSVLAGALAGQSILGVE